MMNKGFIGFVLCIGLIMAAAVWLGNSDPITPAVVKARSATSVGVVTMDVVNDGLALLGKFLMGAAFAGAFTFAWIHGGKFARQFWIEQRTHRWKPGPNANYQQQGPKMPKLTREDLILLALGNRDGRAPKVNSMRVPRGASQEAGDEIEIDL